MTTTTFPLPLAQTRTRPRLVKTASTLEQAPALLYVTGLPEAPPVAATEKLVL